MVLKLYLQRLGFFIWFLTRYKTSWLEGLEKKMRFECKIKMAEKETSINVIAIRVKLNKMKLVRRYTSTLESEY